MNLLYRKWILWIIVLIIILLYVVIIFQKKDVLENKDTGINSNTEQMYNGVPLSDLYQVEIPQGATLTDAQTVVPASEDKTLSTSARTILMTVTKNGFDPSTVTVNQWDRIELLFSPQDGDYDFSVPYLGTHFFAVKQGTQKRISFEVPTSGTFTFGCLDMCPASGAIKGKIIVLPKDARE